MNNGTREVFWHPKIHVNSPLFPYWNSASFHVAQVLNYLTNNFCRNFYFDFNFFFLNRKYCNCRHWIMQVFNCRSNSNKFSTFLFFHVGAVLSFVLGFFSTDTYVKLIIQLRRAAKAGVNVNIISNFMLNGWIF